MTLRDIFKNILAVLGHFYLLSLMHRFRQLHVSLFDSIVFIVITTLISEPVINKQKSIFTVALFITARA